MTDTARAFQLSDHYEQGVQHAIDETRADTNANDGIDRFRNSLEQHLGRIGASVHRAELQSGRVAL